MENSDAVGHALPYAAASSTFEDNDNGFGEPIRLRCSTNSFDERSGCSWSIAPPPRRPRPNHVRRIDEKHHPSLTDPAIMDIRWSPSCRLSRGWRGQTPLYEWADERCGLLVCKQPIGPRSVDPFTTAARTP
jgi:hypothetical protein